MPEKKIHIDSIYTPIGILHSANLNGNIIKLSNSKREFDGWITKYFGDHLIINKENEKLRVELDGYFTERTKRFNLKVKITGTKFQKRVYKELIRVAYGNLISYGELAKRIGKPKAARAIGNSLSQNPIMLIIPCHRVIRGDGDIGGFSGGVRIKKKLVDLEMRK